MHIELGKRMHKCNLKVNMSKIQGNGGIKDACRGIGPTAGYLSYTVLDIVFILYCQCYSQYNGGCKLRPNQARGNLRGGDLEDNCMTLHHTI